MRQTVPEIFAKTIFYNFDTLYLEEGTFKKICYYYLFFIFLNVLSLFTVFDDNSGTPCKITLVQINTDRVVACFKNRVIFFNTVKEKI